MLFRCDLHTLPTYELQRMSLLKYVNQQNRNYCVSKLSKFKYVICSGSVDLFVASSILCPSLTDRWYYACRYIDQTMQLCEAIKQNMTSLKLHSSISLNTALITWHTFDMILGAVSIRKTVLPGMVIPMLKIRRPNGRLIFNMEITIRR